MGTAISEDYPRWSVTLTTAPASEPVTTAEAKAHLRLTLSDDDTYIDTLITAARQWVESKTQRSLIRQTRKLWLDRFPTINDTHGPYYRGKILLPYGPKDTSGSQPLTPLSYVDTSGTTQTLSTYVFTTADEPPRIESQTGYSWPATYDQPEAVTFSYLAGYGSSGSSVPAALRQAILILVAQMYEFREPEITGTMLSKVGFTAEALLSPYICGWRF